MALLFPSIIPCSLQDDLRHLLRGALRHTELQGILLASLVLHRDKYGLLVFCLFLFSLLKAELFEVG